MITIKLNYTCDKTFYPLLKEGNKIVRIAFNLFKKEDLSLKQCIARIKKDYQFNSDLIDASMIESFCQDGQMVFKSFNERGDKTLIFGSRKNWKKYNKGEITKEAWFKIRDTRSLFFMGKAADRFGNRKFKLNIENNKVIFKSNKRNHYQLNISGLNKRYNDLLKIQMLAEDHICPVTYRISDKHVYISFDESFLKKKEHNFIKDRIAGLDLNPNYISFVVRDSESTIIYKEIIDLTILNKTHNKDKKDYETIQIAKRLSKLCKHYQVEMVGYEDLNMKSKDHRKGKKFNRLVNNSWNRNLFVNNLRKRLNILGIKNKEIVAAYSSTIGQLCYPDDTDSIGAALEIARRALYFKKKFLDKDKNFIDKDILYPKFSYEKIIERWNSKLLDYKVKNKGWKSIHEYLYRSKKKPIEFRLLFKDYDFSSWSSFRNKSIKSLTTIVIK